MTCVWLLIAAWWRRQERRWLLLALEARDMGVHSAYAYERAQSASERAVVSRAKARRR